MFGEHLVIQVYYWLLASSLNTALGLLPLTCVCWGRASALVPRLCNCRSFHVLITDLLSFIMSAWCVHVCVHDTCLKLKCNHLNVHEGSGGSPGAPRVSCVTLALLSLSFTVVAPYDIVTLPSALPLRLNILIL